jgi:diguanylate cyclase (GGDEF)-like protein
VRALVVDPEESAAVRDHLIASGCDDLVTASCGEAALCLARERAAGLDLVILDLDLPDVDGLAACRRIAAVLPGVPIIACSSRDDEPTIVGAFAAGAHDFVAKPFRFAELAVRVRAALRLREERCKRAQHEQRLVLWARQLEKTKRELESTVCIDQLTGIANRRHFDNLLRSEWRRAARDGTELSIVLFDLDDFHAFNDRYGHVGGDACLARVAQAMAYSLRRASDVLARYGGEELVAILPETDAVGACVVAERLRARVEQLQLPHAGSRCASVVTLSAGVASLRPAAGVAPDALVAAADVALYRAKRDGRNRCRADGVAAEGIVVSRMPWPICPVVIADPFLAQRVPKFLDALRINIEPVVAAVRGGVLAPAISAGQDVRRTSEPLGFAALVELGTRIEDEARRGDRRAVVSTLGELAWYVEHVQVVYRRTVARVV